MAWEVYSLNNGQFDKQIRVLFWHVKIIFLNIGCPKNLIQNQSLKQKWNDLELQYTK
jgi:hypothetical protein